MLPLAKASRLRALVGELDLCMQTTLENPVTSGLVTEWLLSRIGDEQLKHCLAVARELVPELQIPF